MTDNEICKRQFVTTNYAQLEKLC